MGQSAAREKPFLRPLTASVTDSASLAPQLSHRACSRTSSKRSTVASSPFSRQRVGRLQALQLVAVTLHALAELLLRLAVTITCHTRRKLQERLDCHAMASWCAARRQAVRRNRPRRGRTGR